MDDMVKREYYDAMKAKADRLEDMWRKEHEDNKLLRDALAKIADAMTPFVNPEFLIFLKDQEEKSKGRRKERYKAFPLKGRANGEHDDVMQSNDCETDAGDWARIDSEKPEEG